MLKRRKREKSLVKSLMLRLSRAFHQQIIACAEGGYPHEVCGFLLGKLERNGDQTVTKTVGAVLPLENRAETKENRFVLSPTDVYRADKTARVSGQSVIGVFHSHPDVPANPSKTDRKFAWAEFSYLIVPVYNGRAGEAISWVLSPDESGPFVSEYLSLE